MLLHLALLAAASVPLPGDWMRALSMCACGDVDGDGAGDLAIGLPKDGAHGREAGRVIVVSGRDGHTLRELSCDMPWLAFGFAVDGGSDLDGDGKLDLVIGCHRDGFRFVETIGQVWIAPLQQAATCPFRAARSTSEGNDEDFGHVVRIVGDVDGDGLSDFIVENKDSSLIIEPSKPPVRVFSGKSGREIRNFDPQPPGNVHTAADVDGDGILDVAFAQSESVVVLSTRTGKQLLALARADHGLWDVRGAFAAGDIDRDGIQDLALVGFGNSPQTNSVVVFSPNKRRKLWELSGDTIAAADGEQSRFGNLTSCVKPIDDLDGDDVPDLVVGLPGVQRIGVGACLVSGASGSIFRILGGKGEEAFEMNGIGFGDQVAVLGDVDGDRISDVAVATSTCATSEPYELFPGCVRVFSGRTGKLIYGWRPVPGGTPVVYGLAKSSK